MRKPTVITGMICAVVVLSCLFAIDGIGKGKSPTELKIGTFDSRAVAIAYANSEWAKQEYQALKKQLDQAEKDGDTEKAEEIKKRGKKGQERLHRQGFGTASVDNMLEHIKNQFPRIAENAGVDVIMSKWDVVYIDSQIEVVDITDRIVKPFKPGERQLKWIKDLQKVTPFTYDQLDKMDHNY